MRRMNRWASLALIMTAAACGDDQGPGGGPSALLQDTWVATTWEYVDQADPSNKVSFTAQGISVTLTIGASDYTIEFSAPGEPSQTIRGTYAVSGSTFTITETGSSESEAVTFAFSNGNNTLTMSDADTNWDFDEDGTDEPATLQMVFTRQ